MRLPPRFQSLHVVSVRPDYETATKYGAYWTERLLNSPAEHAGINVIDLNKGDCTNKNFDNAIREFNPQMIGGCGHGSPDVFTGQNGDVMLQVGSSEDAELMSGRGGSFLSCSFGAKRQWWIDWGMKAFYGYEKTVYIPAQNFPNHDAELFFKAHYGFDQALIRGVSWLEAWDENDADWISAMQQATPSGQRILLWDYEIRCRAGDDAWRPYTEPPPPPDDVICPWNDFEGPPKEVQDHIKKVHAKYLVDPCIIPQPWREWLKCNLP